MKLAQVRSAGLMCWPKPGITQCPHSVFHMQTLYVFISWHIADSISNLTRESEPHLGHPAELPVSFSEMTQFQSGDLCALLKYLASASSPSSLRLPWYEDALVTACLVEKHEKDMKIELRLNGVHFSKVKKNSFRRHDSNTARPNVSPVTFPLVSLCTFRVNPLSGTSSWCRGYAYSRG